VLQRAQPAAAWSRAIVAESHRNRGIDCRFAASFASTIGFKEIFLRQIPNVSAGLFRPLTRSC
jgi:hypothetical protein